ncbi:HAD-IB family phosphatase [Cuniculiplasma sp. SKW3]|uniref:HAD-IB family phosphatase n=1 Tax=unclassified Cuniculiplasma TaxID=2619706 RepID=UPI003FD4EA39
MMGGLPYSPDHTDRNPVIFFDMDGVLTREKSSWNYVNRNLGIDNSKNYENFKTGRITYEKFLTLDLALWIQSGRARNADTILHLLNQIELFPNAENGCKKLIANGFKIVIVSGGINWLAQRIGEMIGASEVYANIIFAKDGIIQPEGKAVVNPKKKGMIVEEYVSRKRPEFSISVGDSPDDESMFTSTDYSISFNNDLDYENIHGFNLRSDDFMDLADFIISIKEERDEIKGNKR